MAKNARPATAEEIPLYRWPGFYPRQWLILDTTECFDLDLVHATVVAVCVSKEEVRQKLGEFKAANPRSRTLVFKTSPILSDTEVIFSPIFESES